MKKIISLIIILVLTAMAFASCGIINKVENAVIYPDAYSITYEITTAEGLVHTITKTVDTNGNIHFKSIDEEKLYINSNGTYTLYQKNADGEFAAVEGAKYTVDAVEKELALFDSYAKQSTNKFIPTARKSDTTTVAGRNAAVYKIGVNLLAISFHHYYTIDNETGICLGVNVNNKIFGKNTEANEETFICVEFITENIEDLSNKIIK